MKSAGDHTIWEQEHNTYQPPYGYACLFAAQLIIYVLNDVQVLAAPPKLFPSSRASNHWGKKYCAP